MFQALIGNLRCLLLRLINWEKLRLRECFFLRLELFGKNILEKKYVYMIAKS